MAYQSHVVSPDGRFVIAIGPDQQPALYSIDGGTATPIVGLGTDLTPIGWTDRPQTIFATAKDITRLRPVFTIDLSTGHRQQWTELGPRDPAGAPKTMLPLFAPDGKRYAYSVSELAGELFMIEAGQRPSP